MNEYPHVSITVDGEDVVMQGGPHDVAYVLIASGLTNTSRYDLMRIDADGKHVVTHWYGETVMLADGDQFVTASIAATT